MTSAKRSKANRRNARKSTGPKTAEGKARSRMNALKHGLDAKTPILPGEDEAAFRARLDAWKADFPPRNPEEEALIEEAARLAWQLDRAERVQAAFQAECIRIAGDDEARRRDEEAADAAAIGDRLLFGGNGPGEPAHPDAPDHPERLLRRLQSTAAGCRWLLDRWTELWLALRAAGWQPGHRRRAVRLLGKQPADAVDDPMVQAIYLGCFVLAANDPAVFDDQRGTMTTGDFEYFLRRLAGRRVSESLPTDPERARDGLLALVEGVIADLEARAARHAATAERATASMPDRLALDDSPEGRRLRQIQQRLMGSLLRVLNLLMHVRRHPEARSPRPEPDRNLAASPGEPMACEKIRNEPKGPARGEAEPPAASGSSHAAEPESAGTLDANSERPIVCEKIRNEPIAPGRDRVGHASRPDTVPIRPDTERGSPADAASNAHGHPAAGRDPPSSMSGPLRPGGLRLGPMSGLALTFVGD